MTRQDLNKAFAAKVKELCPNAHDVSLCGGSLVVTFLGQQPANVAAALISQIASNVKVWESLEEYADHQPRIDKQNTFKVWRVGGRV